VVKNFFLTRRRGGSATEGDPAGRAPERTSKDDILFLYLNQINFGKRATAEESSLYY
jgi:membrane peptidoglycan carboxypeptidase